MIFGSDCERGDFWSGLTAGVMSDGVACGEAAATRCTPCRTYFGGSLKRSPPSEGVVHVCPREPPQGSCRLPVPKTAPQAVMPLASWRFAPLCTPKAACATSCLWRSFLTRGTSGADSLAPAHPQVSRQPSRTQVVTPPAFATRRGCGSNSLPKPGRKWGLGKRIAFSL